MSEVLLPLLVRQALLLSVALALLWALRPLLLKRLGAGATYAAWLLVPALLLTPTLPRPVQEPLRVVLQATNGVVPAALPALPTPPANQSALWLSLWLAGAMAVVTAQAARQWRLARLGERLPAGSSPALVGLLRPRVALPADFEQRFAPAERELILAHEQVHRERLDNLWNLLTWALAALHWWNPLAWWAVRRLQADQELACDAAVLASRPGAAHTYTRALLAAHGLEPHGAPLASRWGTTHPLVERIAMLNRPSSLSRRRAAALCLGLLGIAGAAYAAQAQPEGQPPAATAQKVEIRMEMASGEFKATPRLITALGVKSTIEWGAAPGDTWRLDFVVNRADDGKLEVVTDSRHRGSVVGHHTSTVADGAPFAMQLSGAEGSQPLRLNRVVTLLPADYKLPGKVVKPPQ